MQVILVDEKDNFLAYEELFEAHHGKGKRHRAFVTLLFNSKNEVLLQKRKHRLFDGFWDLTAISHPLHLGKRDETYKEASDRALKKEMGIKSVPVEKIGAFVYTAKDGKNSENEYCAVLVGKYSGRFRANNKEVYETKQVPFEDFVNEVKSNSSAFTPWAKKAAKIVASWYKRSYY